MNAETNDTDFRYRATSIDGFAECFAQQTYLSGALIDDEAAEHDVAAMIQEDMMRGLTHGKILAALRQRRKERAAAREQGSK